MTKSKLMNKIHMKTVRDNIIRKNMTPISSLTLDDEIKILEGRIKNCEIDLKNLFPNGNENIKNKVKNLKIQIKDLKEKELLKGGKENMTKEKKSKENKKIKEQKINVPLSMCKKFLASKGMHVQPEAIKKFEKMFREWANTIAISATVNAKEAKRKTIYAEDISASVEVESTQIEDDTPALIDVSNEQEESDDD